MTSSLAARYLRSSDIPRVKEIADANRHALGFQPKAKFEEVAEEHRCLVAIVNGEIMGFVTFRHRMRDLQTTLSDLCVDESYRKHGIGRFLIDTLFEESTQKGRSFILLKCPQDLESNAFYEHIGFVLERIEAGKSRKLKVWRLNIQRDKLN